MGSVLYTECGAFQFGARDWGAIAVYTGFSFYSGEVFVHILPSHNPPRFPTLSLLDQRRCCDPL